MTTPAEVVQAMLVQLELVIAPGPVNLTVPYQQVPNDGSTVCWVSSMPDDVDQGVCIFDMAGLLFGRSQRSKTLEHYGIRVNMRALDYQQGYALMKSIADAFDAFQIGTVTAGIPPDQTSHYVQSIYRTSPLVSLGEEVTRHRQLFSLNARIAMQDQEP